MTRMRQYGSQSFDGSSAVGGGGGMCSMMDCTLYMSDEEDSQVDIQQFFDDSFDESFDKSEDWTPRNGSKVRFDDSPVDGEDEQEDLNSGSDKGFLRTKAISFDSDASETEESEESSIFDERSVDNQSVVTAGQTVEIVLPPSNIDTGRQSRAQFLAQRVSGYSRRRTKELKSSLQKIPEKAAKVTSTVGTQISRARSSIRERTKDNDAAEGPRTAILPLNDTDDCEEEKIKIMAKIDGLKTVTSIDGSLNNDREEEKNKDKKSKGRSKAVISSVLVTSRRASSKALGATRAVTSKAVFASKNITNTFTNSMVQILKRKIALIQSTNNRNKAIMSMEDVDDNKGEQRKDEIRKVPSKIFIRPEMSIRDKVGEKASHVYRKFFQALAGENVESKIPDDGIPTLKRFKVNDNGTVSGYVMNSATVPCVNKKYFKDGKKVTTYPVKGNKKDGEVVISKNGSKYRLVA